MTTNSDLAAEGRATALENPNMSPPRLNRAEAWRKPLRPITEVLKSVSLMIQNSTTSRLRWKFQLHIKATFFWQPPSTPQWRRCALVLETSRGTDQIKAI
jgi:hypothetical protein